MKRALHREHQRRLEQHLRQFRGTPEGRLSPRLAHLVLHLRGLLDLGVADHVDLAHDLLAEEVADLAALPVVDDGEVDGEMGVREAQDLAR